MSKQCEFKIGNIVDPKLWANPRTMSSQQLQSFTSLEMVRLNYTFKTLKKSLPYIVGVISGCLITKFVVDGLVQGFIFGNGGRLLEMKTYHNIVDYTYNRQFQRMRYLTELPPGDDSLVTTSDYLLHDLEQVINNLEYNIMLQREYHMINICYDYQYKVQNKQINQQINKQLISLLIFININKIIV